MGLFNFKKSETKKANNNKITKYVDKESLPNDVKELENMFFYYLNSKENTREIKDNILTKAHHLLKQQTPYDKFNWARGRYAHILDDYKEYGSYEFDLFIKDLSECYLGKKTYKQQLKGIFPFDFVGTIYHEKYGRNFTYHYETDLTKDMKQQNAVIEHFETHIPDLIEAIFDLHHKEEETNSLLHTSYYLYEDLFDYIYNSNERYSFGIWKQTKKYLTYAHTVHTGSASYKKSFAAHITDYDYYTKIAINAWHNCTKEKILNAYHDNQYYKEKISPFITQDIEKLHVSHQLETALSHILNMNQNSILNLRKKADIGNFLYTYHKKYTQDEHDILNSIYLMEAFKKTYISYDERMSSIVSSHIDSLHSLYLNLQIKKELSKDDEEFIKHLQKGIIEDTLITPDEPSVSFEVGPMMTDRLFRVDMLNWFDQVTQTYQITAMTLEDPDGNIYNLLNQKDIYEFVNTTHYKGLITIQGKERITAASNLIYELFHNIVISMSTYTKCLGIIEQQNK